MNINNIKTNIVTNNDDISLAIESLQKSIIKLVLVVENNQLVGTITDGDIRRALLSGKNLQTKCKDVMNVNPKCALVDDYNNINWKNRTDAESLIDRGSTSISSGSYSGIENIVRSLWQLMSHEDEERTKGRTDLPGIG